MNITPGIWCDGTAVEAGDFYAAVFRDTSVTGTTRYPDEGLPEFQAGMAGEPLTVDVDVAGRRLMLINAGPEFTPNHSISFLLNFDPAALGGEDGARSYLDEVHAALIDGGDELMPLGEYAHSPRYAWVRDRYGVTWQLMLTDPEGDPRPFLTPCLMFAGENQDRAEEATDYWMSVIDDSSRGALHRTADGAVLFTDFLLGGDWFAAMDSAVPQDLAFNEGISLEIRCAGQDGIDRLWRALSSDPAAEQCGWCRDRYGLSWQVVPENIDELMARPGAYGALMGMKKIDVAAFG